MQLAGFIQDPSAKRKELKYVEELLDEYESLLLQVEQKKLSEDDVVSEIQKFHTLMKNTNVEFKVGKSVNTEFENLPIKDVISKIIN